MLSVIIYGRNDNHGYLLRKRLCISLNCIADLLTHPNDEIIFADYNTPNDLPTIIESVANNLTQKCKDILKIIRIRPHIHDLFSKITQLPVNEPLARNIAIRHSNPDSRWILSTNTDMIFLTKDNLGLSHLLSEIDDGFYLLPRFDLPEFFWENYFHVTNPTQIFSCLHQQAQKYHFNFTIKCYHPHVLYDNPGDFQLMSREQLFAIRGFDESMILGWHVDSNLCERMYLLQGPPKTLTKEIKGYHCNHYRNLTKVHNSQRTENNWATYVDELKTPIANNEDWGMPQTNFEVFHLSEANKTLTVIDSVISDMSVQNDKTHDQAEFKFNNYIYDTPHLFPFVLNHLLYLEKNTSLIYIGYNQMITALLRKFWVKNGNQGSFTSIEPQEKHFLKNNVESNSLLIFDFGFDFSAQMPEASLKKRINEVCITFLKTMKMFKLKRMAALKNIQLMGINLIDDKYKTFFLFHVPCSTTCYCTNVHVGSKSNITLINFRFILRAIFSAPLFKKLTKYYFYQCCLLFTNGLLSQYRKPLRHCYLFLFKKNRA